MIKPAEVFAKMGDQVLACALDHVPQFLPHGLEVEAAAIEAASASEGSDWILDRSVAIVPVHGLLMRADNGFSKYFGWATYEGLRRTAAELGARDDINAVVLHVQSPGGDAHGVREVFQAIADIGKPTFAIVDRMAASAAYWIASAAQEITVSETDQVGSIGIMARGWTAVGPSFDGEQGWLIRSSNAPAKNPDGLSDEGRARIVARMDRLEAMFLEDVAAGRGISSEAVASVEGAVLMGADALAAGLVDLVSDPNARLAEIMTEHGSNDAPGATSIRPRARSAQARAAAAKALVAIET